MRITPSCPRRTIGCRDYLIVLLSLVALGLGSPGRAEASTEAEQWLDKMMQAARSLNYDGTFVYRSGPHLQSMRVIHRVDPDGNRRERLVSLSGVAWEVLRDGAQVTCILPDERSVVIGKNRRRSFLASPVFKAPLQSSQHYEFSVAGADRVAGRPTEIVTVTPLDPYRYGFRLWVDHETGLLLKSELIGEEGLPLEQFVYTSIEMHQEIPDQLLKPGLSGSGFKQYHHGTASKPSAKTSASETWRVTWLPPGFILSEDASDTIAKPQVSVKRLVYTDGLSSFLVLMEPLESPRQAQQGLSKMGAVNAYGRLVDGHQVTVFGEVPATTVEQVGNSIERYRSGVD
ncbi:MAG: MucB/RseB C-terminal domain-containing protein [Gammaproteobacteria bacterium]